MKIVYRYILRSYFAPLLMTFFIALFILLMQFLWTWVDEFVGKGLEWYVIFEILFYASATLVSMALPLAILLSSLMTFGNMGEHYELVALKASGIPLKTVMKPLIVFSVLLSVIAFFFSNNVLPVAQLKLSTKIYDIRQKKLAFDLKEGMYYKGIDDFAIRVNKKDEDGSGIHDIMIYDHTDKRGNIKVTVAKDGEMKLTYAQDAIQFSLYDGYNYEEMVTQDGYREKLQFQRIGFKEQHRKLKLAGFGLKQTNEDLFKTNERMLTVDQLDYAIDSVTRQYTKAKSRSFENAKNAFFYFQSVDSIHMVNREDSVIVGNTNTAAFTFLAALSDLDFEKTINKAQNRVRSMQKSYANRARNNEIMEKRIRRYYAAWHEKFTLSVACLVLFFIGAPLGAIIRKGGLGLPVVVSAFFFIFFHILSISGKKSVISGVLSPVEGMWIANAVLFPLGIFLTYKATSDSPLFDSEVWLRIFTRFKPKKQKK